MTYPRRGPVLEGAAVVLAVAFGLLAACDLPTGGPSFETEAEINGPLVAEKTFAFLGGPQSTHEPLIDTTTTTFDSLFTIGGDPAQSIFIEDEVSTLDVGSLDDALDEATAGVGLDEELSNMVLQDTDLASEEVNAGYSQTNGVFESDPVGAASPVEQSGADDTVELPFPIDNLGTPPFGGEDATIRSVLLTTETSQDGMVVNHLTFTLENDPANPSPLTDGSGDAPVLELQDANDDRIVAARFPDTVAPGESESVDLDVSGRVLGEGTDVVLTIDGSNARDTRLEIDTSRFRYQETTLENVTEVNVAGDTSDVSTVAEANTKFAGIEVRSGTLQLAINNGLSFPITVDSLTLDNNPGTLDPLPSDFAPLNVSKSVPDPIPPGATETLSLDLDDRGIASAVDVKLRITSAQQGGTVTFSADGSLGASVSGTLTVGSLYFWPNGEEVQAGGSFAFKTHRVQFPQPGDFVELAGGQLALDDFVSEPQVAFDAVTVSLPDLRRPPYAPADSVVLRFAKNASGDFDFAPIGVDDPPRNVEVDLSGRDLRLFPTGNRVAYHVNGVLETIPSGAESTQNLRHIGLEDEVRADVSVGNLDVRALEAAVSPFSVFATSDADGNGQLDLADDAESSTVSLDGFGTLAGSLEGLQVEGSRLTVSITTDAGTNARLYAAIQGRQEDTQRFLAGRGERRVALGDTLGDNFFQGSSRIATENLIQLPLPAAPTDDPITQSLTLTDDNSTADDFLSALPTSIRFAGQVLMLGDANDRIRLRRPLTFEAGLNASVPVRFEGSFTVRDTMDADLSSLQDLTDPDKNVTVSSAQLDVDYTNRVPMGADVDITVLDADGNDVLRIPGDDEALHIEPAPKEDNGTTAGPAAGTVPIELTEQDVRALAQGDRLILRLTIKQQEEGPAATVRATDTIQLSLRAKIDGTVSVGN